MFKNTIKFVLLLILVLVVFCFSFSVLAESIQSEKDTGQRGTTYIADGVYAIRNYGSDYYMDVRYNSESAGNEIQQYNLGSVPDSESERGSLFKVERISGTNRYIIRTMTNNFNGILRSGSNVVTGSVSTTSSNVSASQTWVITHKGSGRYTIASYNSTTGAADSDLLVAPNTYSSGSGAGDASKLKFSSTSSSSNLSKWEFIEYTGSWFAGCSITAPTSISINSGSTYTMPTPTVRWFYSTDVYTNTAGSLIGYSLEDFNGEPTVTATVSSSGVITSISNKFGIIYVRAHYSSGAASDTVTVLIKPTNGTYVMLQNIQTSNGIELGCMQVSGTSIIKKDANFDGTQVWSISYPISGQNYVMLQNVATGLYLTSPQSVVEYAAITAQGLLPYTQRYINGQSGSYPDMTQLWTITTTPTGQSKIQSEYQKTYAPTMYLNVKSYSDATLVQSTWMNNLSYLDEFNVLDVYGGNEEVVVYGADTYDVPASQDLCAMTISKHLSMTQSSSYDTFALYPFTNQKVAEVRQKIAQSKITVIMGHASPSSISINKNQSVYLWSSYLTSLDMSGVELILFEGCSTAGTPSSGVNLPQTAVNSGATAAVGFTQNLSEIIIQHDPQYDSYFYRFNDVLFQELKEGSTLAVACENAAACGGSFDTFRIYGYQNYTLN